MRYSSEYPIEVREAYDDPPVDASPACHEFAVAVGTHKRGVTRGVCVFPASVIPFVLDPAARLQAQREAAGMTYDEAA